MMKSRLIKAIAIAAIMVGFSAVNASAWSNGWPMMGGGGYANGPVNGNYMQGYPMMNRGYGMMNGGYGGYGMMNGGYGGYGMMNGGYGCW